MPRDTACAVYILTNDRHTVLYTGVTGDLRKRLWAHRHHLDPRSFTSRYNARKLVYFETTSNIQAAIAREKQIKNWKRAWKIRLIESTNPEWKDLSADWV